MAVDDDPAEPERNPESFKIADVIVEAVLARGGGAVRPTASERVEVDDLSRIGEAFERRIEVAVRHARAAGNQHERRAAADRAIPEPVTVDEREPSCRFVLTLW